MPDNLLEQLGETKVPAPPPRLQAAVRERMNTSLMTLYVVDFLLRGMPWAVMHFAQALGGAVLLTISGDYEPRATDDARRD
jgi:hypothetical protein